MNNLLDDLAELLPGAHRYENYIACLCLWHSDSQPSMFVYNDTFSCKSCGKFGNTKALYEQLKTHSIPHRPVVTKSQPRNPISNWIEVYGSLAKAMYVAHKNLLAHPHMATYLTERRGITLETCKALGIGILDGWICVPFFDIQHHIIGCTIRVGGHVPYRLYINPKGQNPNLLFDTDPKRTAQAKEVYLLFGIFDAVTLWQAGKAAISTSTGKRLDASALDHIRKPIIIVPDVGEEREAYLLASKLGWRGRVRQLPDIDNVKDVNNLWTIQPKTLLSFIGA